MAITWSNVTDIAPELASLSVGSQNEILAEVALQMNADVWESKLDTGSKWLAAHLATVGPRRKGSGGPVSQESVGQVSRSYATTGAAMSNLGASSYGQEYERLIMTLPGARFEMCDG